MGTETSPLILSRRDWGGSEGSSRRCTFVRERRQREWRAGGTTAKKGGWPGGRHARTTYTRTESQSAGGRSCSLQSARFPTDIARGDGEGETDEVYLDLKPALKNPGARAARGTRRRGGGRRSAGERKSVALRRRRRGEATDRTLERREGPGGAPEAVDRRASARTEPLIYHRTG